MDTGSMTVSLKDPNQDNILIQEIIPSQQYLLQVSGFPPSTELSPNLIGSMTSIDPITKVSRRRLVMLPLLLSFSFYDGCFLLPLSLLWLIIYYYLISGSLLRTLYRRKSLSKPVPLCVSLLKLMKEVMLKSFGLLPANYLQVS